MSIQDAKPPARRRPRGTAGAGGRAETAGQRRERIVRLAAPLFLKKGYDNVSIDEIIGVVGGSKATIYAWFGGKEACSKPWSGRNAATSHGDPCGPGRQPGGTATEIGHSFLAMVLSPPILEFHRLMVSIGPTFPATGRLFYQTGPASAYSAVAT